MTLVQKAARHQTATALGVLALFLTAHLLIPLVGGDIYPFTSAPMFRDNPTRYASYRVFDAAGKELPQRDWLLQRVYDGNPIGYGVGLKPPPVIEQEFGQITDESAVVAHIRRQSTRPENRRHEFVDVVRAVIGPVDSQRVGEMGEPQKIRVELRPAGIGQ